MIYYVLFIVYYLYVCIYIIYFIFILKFCIVINLFKYLLMLNRAFLNPDYTLESPESGKLQKNPGTWHRPTSNESESLGGKPEEQTILCVLMQF